MISRTTDLLWGCYGELPEELEGGLPTVEEIEAELTREESGQ